MHKLIKFSFNATINALKAYQFFLILFALTTMVVFVLSLCKIALPEQVQVVFDWVYKFQSLIYKPNLSVIPVDFTLAVFAIELLIFAGLIVYVISFVIEFENTYDKVHQDGEKRFEKKFNKQLEQNFQKIENKNKNFVMYFDVFIEKVNQDFVFDEQKPINVEAKILEYRLMFKNYMSQNFNVTCQKTDKGFLLFFDNIDVCDSVFDKTFAFTAKTKEMLKQAHLKFNLKTAVCIATPKDNSEEYLSKLQKLISIAAPKKIMALSDFKTKYENLKSKTYIVNSLGEYGLGDAIIDVYTLESSHHQ